MYSSGTSNSKLILYQRLSELEAEQSRLEYLGTLDLYKTHSIYSFSEITDGKCVIPKYTEDKSWMYEEDVLTPKIDSSAFFYFVNISVFNLTQGDYWCWMHTFLHRSKLGAF